MGKASKWIRNFLLGIKKDQEKVNKEEKKAVKNIISSSSNSVPEEEEEEASERSPNQAILSVTKEKRRWSFRKSSTTTNKITQRNRSFDSISTVRLVKQVLEEHEIEQIRIKAHVLVKSCNEVKGRSSNIAPFATNNNAKSQAAIIIQSAFRSYLARKALRALRALVKLQALVRGHLVRKQTTAVLRSMHALMTIQVRARYKRVQMVETGSNPETLYNKSHKTEKSIDHEGRKRLEGRSGSFDQYSKVETMEQGYSMRKSSCNGEGHQEEDVKTWSPSAIFNDIIISSKDNNNGKHKGTNLPAALSSSTSHNYHHPSYMSNTQSSKAKGRIRSQSEPKQRPKIGTTQNQKSRRSMSIENQQPWLIKLYRSARPLKDAI
ncbi:OLC1v1000908C1 [Oldenlandia corymbosa var. corymbosa]|uniref:OLC1v1000908C1 n=1 Tax=Oldenlandia corymbosa var. corymbosa TaxID=529605 RepID=A0AAV1D3W5_OLDCO|nr:OLC1v1000908C1 [Oldenlandia corymbosa var. corymbosa]